MLEVRVCYVVFAFICVCWLDCDFQSVALYFLIDVSSCIILLKIEESPLQELYGHFGNVMCLAWSDCVYYGAKVC
jgi:hypothetical protein